MGPIRRVFVCDQLFDQRRKGLGVVAVGLAWKDLEEVPLQIDHSIFLPRPVCVRSLPFLRDANQFK